MVGYKTLNLEMHVRIMPREILYKIFSFGYLYNIINKRCNWAASERRKGIVFDYYWLHLVEWQGEND